MAENEEQCHIVFKELSESLWKLYTQLDLPIRCVSTFYSRCTNSSVNFTILLTAFEIALVRLSEISQNQLGQT